VSTEAEGCAVGGRLQHGPQAEGLRVEVADLDGVERGGVGQQWADGMEFGERLIGVAVDGWQLRGDETYRGPCVARLPCGRVGVLHVEAQLEEGLTRRGRAGWAATPLVRPAKAVAPWVS
jgi:hypothetical protein